MIACTRCNANNPEDRMTCYGCGGWLESPPTLSERPPAEAAAGGLYSGEERQVSELPHGRPVALQEIRRGPG